MKQITKQALCVNCDFHKHIIKNSSAPNVWYNHFCSANPRKCAINPVTGEACFMGVNDFGQKYYTKDAFKYCRDINKDGECLDFKGEK